jgi:hypothetical protein
MPMSLTVGMIGGRVRIKAPTNCGSDWRLGPYQGSDQELRLGSALHVPTSLTGRLVGRIGPAYQRAPGVGAEDKDEPQG